MTIKIEKGIPIPNRRKYPWREMQVGDSFATDASGVNAALTFSRNNKELKFASRKQPDGTYRIWRVK